MVTKCASEIIHGAMVKASVYNIDFLDSLTLTNELNNYYRSLYDRIALSDMDYYIKYIKINTPEFDLPDDIYIIKTIEWSDTREAITKSPDKEFLVNSYKIENNHFSFRGELKSDILIRYVPTPQTITTPREEYQINIDYDKILEVDENGFYYKLGDDFYYYDFDSDSSEIADWEYRDIPYGRLKLDIDYEEQIVTASEIRYDSDEYDLTEYFTNPYHGNFTKIVWDFPYIVISYEDGEILIADNFKLNKWNAIGQKTGKPARGEVLGINYNDETLYGVLYTNGKKLYRASFVPDTVLNYPNNALFNVLEINLAKLLMSMNGIENKYISEELSTTAELEFNSSLRMDRSHVAQIRSSGGYRYYK